MTATKAGTNNTETIEDQTPVVEVEVVSSDNTDNRTMPAPLTAEQVKEGEELIRLRQQLDKAEQALRSAQEEGNQFFDLGPVYTAGAPMANAVGIEFGVVTTDDTTGNKHRSGIGVYIRSDHLGKTFAPTPADKKPAG
jgi:hypothetical protein